MKSVSFACITESTANVNPQKKSHIARVSHNAVPYLRGGLLHRADGVFGVRALALGRDKLLLHARDAAQQRVLLRLQVLHAHHQVRVDLAVDRCDGEDRGRRCAVQERKLRTKQVR